MMTHSPTAGGRTAKPPAASPARRRHHCQLCYPCHHHLLGRRLPHPL